MTFVFERISELCVNLMKINSLKLNSMVRKFFLQAFIYLFYGSCSPKGYESPENVVEQQPTLQASGSSSPPAASYEIKNASFSRV